MAKSAPRWEVNNLRLSLFLPSALPAAVDVWASLVGGEPDFDENRAKDGIRRQGGPFAGGQMEVRSALGRLDLLLTPKPVQGQGNALAMPQIGVGELIDVLSSLENAVAKWLPSFHEAVVRMALGGVAVLEVPTRGDAFSELGSLLSSLKVDEEMHDLTYRVNRRKPVEIADIGYCNRITTWSVAQLILAFGTSLAEVSGQITKHLVQLEFDVNTPAERKTALPEDQMLAIFQQLKSMVVENATAGEVK